MFTRTVKNLKDFGIDLLEIIWRIRFTLKMMWLRRKFNENLWRKFVCSWGKSRVGLVDYGWRSTPESIAVFVHIDNGGMSV